MAKLHSPTNLGEAIQLLNGDPTGQVLAGGVATLQRARIEGRLASTYIHLGGIPDVHGIQMHKGSLIIGAMTSLASVASSLAVAEAAPLLRDAATQAASPGVRAQATLGGNLVAAAAASDLAAALLALGASVRLADQHGQTVVGLSNAVAQGPAWVPAGSILVSVSVPQAGSVGWGFERLPLRGAADSSAATLAVGLAIAQQRVATARAWATAVADRPLRLARFESLLKGQYVGEIAALETDEGLRQAADADTEGATLLDDARASGWYRAAVIVELAFRAAVTAARRASQ